MAVVEAIVQLQKQPLCAERASLVSVAEGSSLSWSGLLGGVFRFGLRYVFPQRLGVGNAQ